MHEGSKNRGYMGDSLVLDQPCSTMVVQRMDQDFCMHIQGMPEGQGTKSAGIVRLLAHPKRLPGLIKSILAYPKRVPGLIKFIECTAL